VRATVSLVLLVALAACASDPAPAPRRDSGDKDPWAYFERGAADEAAGDLDKAVEEYGAAVALLPARRVTRPAVSLGRVHLKRARWEPARRMFEEVLNTVPDDIRRYKENPDYREAALGLKEVFAHISDPRAEERARARFLDEMGGSEKDWPSR
jgi:tetratricopeptide (TPR) repeat protein